MTKGIHINIHYSHYLQTMATQCFDISGEKTVNSKKEMAHLFKFHGNLRGNYLPALYKLKDISDINIVFFNESEN